MLLLCVTHNDKIKCDELWFHTGVQDRLRYIPALKIAAGVGPLRCKTLAAFHVLTGCDFTSALSRVRKKKAWKIITSSIWFVWDNPLMRIQKQQEKLKPSSEACTTFSIESQLVLTRLAIYSFVKKHRATFNFLQRLTVFCSTSKERIIKPTCEERHWCHDKIFPLLQVTAGQSKVIPCSLN